MFDLLSSWFSHQTPENRTFSLDTTFIIAVLFLAALFTTIFYFRKKILFLTEKKRELIELREFKERHGTQPQGKYHYEQC